MKIIAPHMSCVVTLPLTKDDPDEFQQAISEGYVEIYVVTPNGIIKHHKLRGTNRFLRLKVDAIPNTPLITLREEINFLPQGKVPHELFKKIEAFFRKVMEVKKEELEAMIWVLWNEEQGYYLHVPDQTISKASVRYDWDSVPAGSSIVVDIHSHNTMGAFFSGTDNNDDQNGIRFSGVFGKLDRASPETVWRFNYRDKKYEAKVSDIFEQAEAEEIDVPEEWISQVKTYSFSSSRGNPLGMYMGQGTYLQNRFNLMDRSDDGDDRTLSPHTGKKKDSSSKKASDSLVTGMARESENFMADFWELGPAQEDALMERAERVFVTGEVEDLGSPVGAEESAETNAIEALIHGSLLDSRFDELAINKGVKVATGFCVINSLMAELDGEVDLVEEIVGDMVGMLEGRDRAKILRMVYDCLPPAEKEKLATTGF